MNKITPCFVCLRARRAAKEAKEAPAQPAPAKVKVEVKKFVKIGRPGYKGKLAAWLIISAVLFVLYPDVGLTVNVLCFNIWDMCFFFVNSNQTEGPRDRTAVLTFPGWCFWFWSLYITCCFGRVLKQSKLILKVNSRDAVKLSWFFFFGFCNLALHQRQLTPQLQVMFKTLNHPQLAV